MSKQFTEVGFWITIILIFGGMAVGIFYPTSFPLKVLNSCGIITDGYGHGSCVAIGPNLILTAGHCLNQEEIWIEINGIKYEVLETWKSEDYDVGFVIIDGEVPYLQLGQMPELLDDIYLIGSPYDISFINTITKGIVSSFNRNVYDRIDLIQVDAEAAPGSSGCPLFNLDGMIIGICVAGPNPGGGVTLCVSVNHILEVLEEYNAL